VDGRPVALDGVVSRVMEDHKLGTASRNLEVRADLERVGTVGDPEQLRVIVDNLMSNAVKYSPQDGTIHIGLRRHDGRAVIDVRDEGPGVQREERGRVFEAFYQGGATYAGHVKGTGLGLAIAREYAHMHQGEIDLLDSKRGAHFRVLLPLAPATAAGPSAAGAGTDAPA